MKPSRFTEEQTIGVQVTLSAPSVGRRRRRLRRRRSAHVSPRHSNCERTRLITLCQSPGFGCRKSRAVGYQRLSSRSSNQRQSTWNASKIQTGLRNAPAKCATAVSTVMTKSSCSIAAAVSARSAKLRADVPNIAAADCQFVAVTKVVLKAIEFEILESREREQYGRWHRAPGVIGLLRISGPDKADLALVCPSQTTPPNLAAIVWHRKIGNIVRDRLKSGAEGDC